MPDMFQVGAKFAEEGMSARGSFLGEISDVLDHRGRRPFRGSRRFVRQRQTQT